MTRTSWQATAACGCQTEALGEEEKDKTVVKEGMLDLTDDRKSCFQWLYEVLMVEHSVVWSMQSVFGWGFVRGLMDNKVAQLARRRSGWWLKECWRKRDWEWVCGERGEQRGWDRLADARPRDISSSAQCRHPSPDRERLKGVLRCEVVSCHTLICVFIGSRHG